MKVSYSPRAIADLIENSEYLKSRSPQGAFAVGRRIEEVVERLAEFPGMGRVLEQRPTVRVVPLGRFPYLIFYESIEDELIILHVRHGAHKPVEQGEL